MSTFSASGGGGRRAAALDETIAQADAGIADAARTVPAIFLSEERYAQQMRAAERDWVNALAAQLRPGELTWPRRRVPTRRAEVSG